MLTKYYLCHGEIEPSLTPYLGGSAYAVHYAKNHTFVLSVESAPVLHNILSSRAIYLGDTLEGAQKAARTYNLPGFTHGNNN